MEMKDATTVPARRETHWIRTEHVRHYHLSNYHGIQVACRASSPCLGNVATHIDAETPRVLVIVGLDGIKSTPVEQLACRTFLWFALDESSFWQGNVTSGWQ